uniref:Syntaxin-binding protein 5-like n=1 Tax=Cyprinus carpio TaxID=7962 RepID=A0A8C1ZRZ0_CYPCA
MKKFRKVLDGLTTSSPANPGGSPACGSAAGTPSTAPTPRELEIQETLMSEHFQICKTVRHGVPYQPTALAFDPVQKILAIGSRSGGVRLLGRPGVDCHCQHESGAAVLQLQFLINEGALVTACADDTLHLWNLRQRRPAILHSLKFNRERITFCHLPFQSKWLYVGTERGNTHIVNIESFILSGYVIMWNKALEFCNTHPYLCFHYLLFFCFESGTIVMWDLRAKRTDFRIYYDEVSLKEFVSLTSDVFFALRSFLHKGKSLSCSFPIFENPYPMDIHESPVTCTAYFADCPPDIIPVLYSIGAKHKKTGYSHKEWPVSGGTWTVGSQTYPEIIITGHADGSIKFWDATAITLQMLYKLKTSKVFEKPKSGDVGRSAELVEEDPYAVQMISWCPQSRILCVVGISAHVILYRFSKHDAMDLMDQLLLYVCMEDVISPSDTENTPSFSDPSGHSPQPQPPSPRSNTPDSMRDSIPCLKVKDRMIRMPPGYQAELVVQLLWVDGEPPQQITSLDLNSAYGLLALGNCNGLTVVDYLQKTILLCMSTLELYGSADPFQRLTRSPRKNRQSTSGTHAPCVSESHECSNAVCFFVTKLKLSLPTDLKTDLGTVENSFSRSRSSSVSSIDRETKEAVTTLQFAESYGHKSDTLPTPCLWVGTSLGLVLIIPMSIPTDEQERLEDPVTVAPTGTVLMLKGSILRIGFLDCGGALINSPYEVWRDQHAPDHPDRPRKRKLVNFSPSSSQEASGDGHLAVVCSERQAKVFFMPSQACLYVHNITESSFVLRADVVSVCNSVCLACFCANGHIMTLSLPSLRPLLDVNYLPLTDMRIARTFCFTNGGQALYLCSPTEIQRITYSQEMCDNLQEMLGELFTPIETPEAQNRGFLKGFFGGNAQTFDREELFGEAAAGKASRSLAQHIPGQGGMEGMKAAAGGVVGELARARIALDERGQRLGELEERTALMMTSAETFSKHAHELMLKCKDKKWYQF